MLKKKYLILILIICASVGSQLVYSQDSSGSESTYPRGARPDIPGMLGVEFGFMQVFTFPDEMQTNFFGTNTFTGFYKYQLPLGNSKFSIHPGIAFSSDKYSFKDNITLTSAATGEGYETTLIGLDSIIDGSVRKSVFKASYIEIPLELTFRTNRESFRRSAKFSVGARGGYLVSSKTKFKYSQDGQNKITKQKERYDLNKFRVLLVGRVAYGNVSLFCTYNLLPIFDENEAPQGTDAQQLSFGLSLELF